MASSPRQVPQGVAVRPPVMVDWDHWLVVNGNELVLPQRPGAPPVRVAIPPLPADLQQVPGRFFDFETRQQPQPICFWLIKVCSLKSSSLGVEGLLWGLELSTALTPWVRGMCTLQGDFGRGRAQCLSLFLFVCEFVGDPSHPTAEAIPDGYEAERVLFHFNLNWMSGDVHRTGTYMILCRRVAEREGDRPQEAAP